MKGEGKEERKSPKRESNTEKQRNREKRE